MSECLIVLWVSNHALQSSRIIYCMCLTYSLIFHKISHSSKTNRYHKGGIWAIYQIWSTSQSEKPNEKQIVFTKRNIRHPDQAKQRQPVTRNEILGFIGLIILAGVHHANHESLQELWSLNTGWLIFCATMSLKRFQATPKVFRFDRNTRALRRATDNWHQYVICGTCSSPSYVFYKPDAHVMMDEQLVASRRKCPFEQYMYLVNLPIMGSKCSGLLMLIRLIPQMEKCT